MLLDKLENVHANKMICSILSRCIVYQQLHDGVTVVLPSLFVHQEVNEHSKTVIVLLL